MSEVTDESARGIEAQIAETLAAHRLTHSKRREWGCTAGDWNMSYALSFPERAHRAHQAAALVPLIATAQADALRDAAGEIVRPVSSSAWRGAYRNCAEWLRARADRVEGGEL